MGGDTACEEGGVDGLGSGSAQLGSAWLPLGLARLGQLRLCLSQPGAARLGPLFSTFRLPGSPP